MQFTSKLLVSRFILTWTSEKFKMKNLLITVAILVITTVVYSLDVERLRMFTDNFAKCSEELGVSPSEPTAEALKCALIKDGQVLNANGEYIKEATMQGLEDVISDAATLEKARGMFTACYDDAVQSGATGDEQTMKIATCSLPIMSLLDKP